MEQQQYAVAKSSAQFAIRRGSKQCAVAMRGVGRASQSYDTEKPYRVGDSVSNLPISVLFPTPDGPQSTTGRSTAALADEAAAAAAASAPDDFWAWIPFRASLIAIPRDPIGRPPDCVSGTSSSALASSLAAVVTCLIKMGAWKFGSGEGGGRDG